MASPLRFRRSTETWNPQRVHDELQQPLDVNIGARASTPDGPRGYRARRFDMDNGDFALFLWNDRESYWIGNTETPSALWQTRKHSFTEVPQPIAVWTQRVLLQDLVRQEPWLDDYPNLAWFFLPVFLSKDGRRTSREFFKEHSAGFPAATTDEALTYYEKFLASGILDPYRYVMASKLGTSNQLDIGRMSATMAEFNAAHILTDSGYSPEPEAEVVTGHSIDYRVDGALVEVTRPQPPSERAVNTAVAALRDTVGTKSAGQLSEHAGDVLLLVDASSFTDTQWSQLKERRPDVSHQPSVVFRVKPGEGAEGYRVGDVPLDLGITWV